MLDALGWQPATPRVLPRRGGASLGFEAPADLLLTATEVNEWAWAHAVERAGGPVAELPEVARARISQLAGEERKTPPDCAGGARRRRTACRSTATTSR